MSGKKGKLKKKENGVAKILISGRFESRICPKWPNLGQNFAALGKETEALMLVF